MCKSSYFPPTSEGHPEMLASHKIAYQFLLPCNPSTILLLSVGINRESTHFVFIRSTNIIEKTKKSTKFFIKILSRKDLVILYRFQNIEIKFYLLEMSQFKVST